MAAIRYQIFVSSTFTDLQEARRQVQLALLQMDCIPAGMELFPAADEEQFEFIQKIIDDCDYYLVLIAGRYGSTTSEGISYTEKEFDHAVQKGIPVLAFLHADLDSIPAGQTELNAAARERLAAFREKARTGRLVKTWKTPEELAGQVALSLGQTMKAKPRAGWIRGPATDTTRLLLQINELQQKNAELEHRLIDLPEIDLSRLSKGTEKFTLRGTIGYPERPWQEEVTWDDILFHIGPELLQWMTDEAVNSTLAESVLKKRGKSAVAGHVDAEIFKTVRIHMMALGDVEVRSFQTHIAMTLFWRLTAVGRQRVLKLRAVPTSEERQEPQA